MLLPKVVQRATHLGMVLIALLAPTAARAVVPANRVGAMMEYDGPRQRMVMWGSLLSNGEEPNMWALSLAPGQPACWSLLTSQGGFLPVRSYYNAHCYDSVHDRILFFGGRSDVCFVGAVPTAHQLAIKFTGPTTYQWQGLTVAGAIPSYRMDYSIVYDPIGNRMIQFGGRADATFNGGMNDCYQLQFTNPAGTEGTWSQIPTPPAMPGRWGHQAILDAARNRMLVFGGVTTETQLFFMIKTWALDLTTLQWTEIGVNGIAPVSAYDFAATYNQENDEIIVYQGQGLQRFQNGSYNWTNVSSNMISTIQLFSTPTTMGWGNYHPANAPSMPISRSGTAIAYDPAGDRLITFGGRDASFYYSPDCPGTIPANGPMQATRIQVPGMGWDYGQWSSIANCAAPDPPPGGGGGGGGGGQFEEGSLSAVGNSLAGHGTIRFTLATSASVRLEVFDQQGRRVRTLLDGAESSGFHTVTWDGMDQSGTRVERGVYFVRLTGPFASRSAKLVMIGR